MPAIFLEEQFAQRLQQHGRSLHIDWGLFGLGFAFTMRGYVHRDKLEGKAAEKVVYKAEITFTTAASKYNHK